MAFSESTEEVSAHLVAALLGRQVIGYRVPDPQADDHQRSRDGTAYRSGSGHPGTERSCQLQAVVGINAETGSVSEQHACAQL